MSSCNCDQRVKYWSTQVRLVELQIERSSLQGHSVLLHGFWIWRQGPLNVWTFHEEVEHLTRARDHLRTIAVRVRIFFFPMNWHLEILFQISRWEAYEFKKNRTWNPYCMMEEYLILWSLATNDVMMAENNRQERKLAKTTVFLLLSCKILCNKGKGGDIHTPGRRCYVRVKYT